MSDETGADALPQVGDIWREVDPRCERFVRIESVGVVTTHSRSIGIRTVIRRESGWIAVPRTRTSYARLDRFRGKRGGYALHERAGAASAGERA